MRILYFKDPQEATAAAANFMEAGTIPTADMQISVGSESFLCTGGVKLFDEAALSPKYSIVKQLYAGPADGRDAIGHASFKLTHDMGLQFGEIAVYEDASVTGGALLVMVPHPEHAQLSHPHRRGTLSVPRFAVVIRSLPPRRLLDLSVKQACDIIGASDPRPLCSALETLGCSIAPEDQAALAADWAGSSIKDRIRDGYAIYEASHAESHGEHFWMHSLESDWPFAGLSFPCERKKDVDYDLSNTFDRAAVRNLLVYLSMNTMAYSITRYQAQLLQDALIPLGKSYDNAVQPVPEVDFWAGRSEAGNSVYGAGAFIAGSSELHVVSFDGAVEPGEMIYRDTTYRQPLGRLAATLWKPKNHSYFFKAESQRGTGLVLATQ